MRILWVPHCPWHEIEGQREHHLTRGLRDRFEVHVVTWGSRCPEAAARRWGAWRRLGDLTTGLAVVDGIVTHRVPRVPDVYNAVLRRYPTGPIVSMNSALLRRWVRAFVREHRIDVAIHSANYWAWGPPPFDLGVPTGFDYVDWYPDEIAARVLSQADFVTCVSSVLVKQARRFNPRVHYVPNGVDLERFQAADGREIRRRHGLEGRRVVSLIGLTCSPTLYFVDAVGLVRRHWPDVVLVVVGDGPRLAAIRERASALGVDLVAPGRIPVERVQDWFAASDVGLYPGDSALEDQSRQYFDGACPIKVLEYVASGVPVISSPVRELERLKLPGVRLVPPGAESFARAIQSALTGPRPPTPGLGAFNWRALVERFAGILEAAARRGPIPEGAGVAS